MSRRRAAVIIGTVVVMVAVAGAGVGVGHRRERLRFLASDGSGGVGGSMSSYCESMMRNYPGGSMMGGPAGGLSYGW